MSMVRLNFYIKNNFGSDHSETFAQLTKLLVDCTNDMTKHNVGVMSQSFQSHLIKTSIDYLTIHYPDQKFEHFFQRVNDEYFFVINNVIKHPALETSAGQFLHDWYLFNSRMQ